MDVKAAIEAGNAIRLKEILTVTPSLANTPLRWGTNNELLTKPLHFVCDKVFDGTISDDVALGLARVLVGAGADIDDQNGDPLNAAASLGATEVGLLLLDAGARADFRGLLGDMHGNVWEWTADDYCSYAGDGAVADPVATCQSSLKVIRGGRWYFGADSARCALRYTHRPQDRGFSIGFRVERESSPPA